MNLEVVYIKSDAPFSTYVKDWAQRMGLSVMEFESKEHEKEIDGLVVVNANQDIPKEYYEILSYFDKRNVPTHKVDINGTLQVAYSSFNLWYKGNKCKRIYIIGADNLVNNENLDRFFKKLEQSTFATS